MRGSASRLIVGAALAVMGAVWTSPAEAKFRFDEIEPRSFDYNDEYFINVFNYRQRVTLRWRTRSTGTRYAITAGSVRNDELYVDQRALIRIPWGEHFTGQYELVEWEDYDSRYLVNEVEIVFRAFRPEGSIPLYETFGWTPPPDGLFFGGWGQVDADKEFVDLGLITGYRGSAWGVRLDAQAIDYFFNEKNKQFAEYESEPYTFKLQTWLTLLQGNLELRAWFQNDLPLSLRLPERQNGLEFRYRQLRAGLDVSWAASDDVRFDMELWMERTRKRRWAVNDPDPRGTDRLNREALKLYVQFEVDAPTLLDSSSMEEDVVFGGLHVHLLQEITRRPITPLDKDTLRRGESYLELGYVMGIPSFSEKVSWGIRGSLSGGMLSWRDVRPSIAKHRVTEKFLAKAALGVEASILGRFDLFGQLTYRLDELTFGGGNAQITMRF